jgi:hypothetical protein
MGSYTITTSGDEDAAIQHFGGDDAAGFLDRSVHATLVDWVRRFKVSSAPKPADEISYAYLMASTDVQQKVMSDLGLGA